MKESMLKCIYCGETFSADITVEESVCPSCNKTFNTARGAKYFTGMQKISESEKKIAYGEMHSKAENLITEGEFYVKNEDYATAEEKFKSALEITTVDTRVYLGLVKTYTKNFTDATDVKHYEFLKKAIALSNKEEQEKIRAMYKAYYQKRNYTEEETKAYNEEEFNSRKSRCEELLKDGIPRHYKTAKTVKFVNVLLPIIFGLGLALFITALFFKNQTVLFVLNTVACVFAITAIALLVFVSGGKSKNAIYDCALDFYDEVDNLNLTLEEKIQAFTHLELLAVQYLNGVTTLTLENSLLEILVVLVNADNVETETFIKKYKILNKLLNELYEEPEIKN